MIIAVDFDGTCVTHAYPKIGEDIGAVPVLKALVDKGHQIILWTIRSGELLQEAVDWFKANEIPLLDVNQNPTQKNWSQSPKCFAHIFIDDAALGCPLIEERYDGESLIYKRAFADWTSIRKHLERRKII